MKRTFAVLLLCLALTSFLSVSVTAHSVCVDKDRDYWCDECGMGIYHTCVDYNKDTWCDLCSCWIPHDCYDRNSDHECDQCGNLMNVNININVTSYSGGKYGTTLYFYEGNYPNVFKTLPSDTGKVTFSCAAKSYFKLTVMKPGHPTRNFFYNTNLDDITIDAKLYPYGDVTQDGVVTVGDVGKIYSWTKSGEFPSDDYIFQCADVTGDEVINVGDVGKVYAHTRGTAPMW